MRHHAPPHRPHRVQALDADWLWDPNIPFVGFAIACESEHDRWIIAITFLFVSALFDCFKSRRRLEAEILVLRHQFNVLQQRAPRRYT